MYRGKIAFDEEDLDDLSPPNAKLFFGNPCSKCGGCIRWRTSHSCYECKKRQERERQQRRKAFKLK
jgi:hypothetical protein